ncbi:glycosyltransferase [Patescibacteria group bacterium]|nr:glycosyltransferase [Patescibacteria group bacterium]
MKLLVFTQKVDKADPVLGFFHDWLTELSKISESVIVICLEKGQMELPKNVTVYSLGKEEKISKLLYVWNLYKYLYLIHGSYDKVFVHMNQEYVLLAGLYWKVVGIPLYLWRNHPKGNFATLLAILLSKKVFCTSAESFTARFKKTIIMPAGIDTSVFHPVEGSVRKKYSVCMVGRISPIKHIEIALESIKILVASGVQVSLSVIGSVPHKDVPYFEKLNTYIKQNNLSNCVTFLDSVPPSKLPEVYSGHEICLNLTDSGSFDKTIVEASACGAVPLVSNSSLSSLLPTACVTERKPAIIAEAITKLFDPHMRVEIQDELSIFVELQSLNKLIEKLSVEMK